MSLKRKWTIFITSIIILAVFLPALFVPRQTQAFLDSGTIFWPIKVGIDVTNKVATWVEKVLGKAGAIAYKNGLSYFLSRIAEDTAVWVASGDKGGKPLFYTEGWGPYLQQVGDEALGTFMYDLFNTNQVGYCSNNKNKSCKTDDDCGRFDENFKWTGFNAEYVEGGYRDAYCVLSSSNINVCQPASLSSQLIIKYSLIDAQRADRRPVCTWQKIKDNWRDSINDKDFLKNFSVSLQPTQSDIGIWLGTKSNLDNFVVGKKQASTLERGTAGGIKPVADLVGNIQTPAPAVLTAINQPIEGAAAKETTYTGEAWADAINIFSSTLANRLMDKWIKRGMYTLQDLTAGNQGSYGGLSFAGSGSSTLSPEKAAREFFAELGQADYASGGSINVTAMLSSECQNDPQTGSEQHCGIINEDFATAINQKLTIAQAVNQNLINGTSVFGFLKDGTEPNYRDGIGYSSILVLRKFRIVPVGWEIAARYIRDFDSQGNDQGSQFGLKYLMDQYDTPSSPYYRLIDPNWQLKAPATICQRQGPGPDIIDIQTVCDKDTSGDGEITCPPDEQSVFVTRRTYCADERTCVLENEDGRGCQVYGYCLEEKPIWRISGDKCPAYYNSCQTFKIANQQVSYLENSLDSCSQAGCLAYCDSFDPATDSWLCVDQNYPLSFYKSTTGCAASENGCTALTKITNLDQTPLTNAQVSAINLGEDNINNLNYLTSNINLKIAPTYFDDRYDCSGYTLIEDGFTNQEDCENNNHFWRNDIEACVVSGNQFCQNFATSCSLDDVWCRAYTPVAINAPSVAAVISPRECSDGTTTCVDQLVTDWHDECPVSCVGFRNFYQKTTAFEAGSSVSFIASSAQECNQPGCDQFTNLDEVARGGEGLEYFSFLRQCVKPDNNTVQTFYTWEGSDTAGYQLKRWDLATMNDGPQGTVCGLGAVGIDCREFYNPRNSNYYTLDFATVIFASDDCHPYRRRFDNEVYYGLPSYSTPCAAGNAGCRVYRDNSSYNYQVVLSDDFEDSNISNWSGGNLSNESVVRGGHSLSVAGNATYQLNLSDITATNSYAISFLAKGTGAEFVLLNENTPLLMSQPLSFADDWQLYNVELGELTTDNYQQLNLVISGTAYFDYITLKRINNLMLIKDSWQTPTICANLEDLGMTSCEAYRDDQKQTINLQSFSKLCLEEVVGCQAFVQTDIDGDQSWQYLVYDKQKECTVPGCRQLGQLTRDYFTPNEEDSFNFQTTYMQIRENIDECDSQQENCVRMDFIQGGYAHYKYPANRLCQFKDGEWWVVGQENMLCPSIPAENDNSRPRDETDYTKHCLGGRYGSNTDRLNECQSDSECVDYYNFSTPGICTSWVGICPKNQNDCQEYQDPFAPEQCNHTVLANDPDSCNFYWYKNVDSKSCNGANEDDGCVPFVNTSQPLSRPIDQNYQTTDQR